MPIVSKHTDYQLNSANIQYNFHIHKCGTVEFFYNFPHHECGLFTTVLLTLQKVIFYES